MIKLSKTLRKEERQTFKPETSRSFYLFFEVVEYSPKLNKAIDYFFQNVLDPSDDLVIVTPMDTEVKMLSGLTKMLTKNFGSDKLSVQSFTEGMPKKN